MTNVDQFESVFKAATKMPFVYQAIEIRKLLFVTDLDEEAARQLSGQARDFLSVLGEGDALDCRVAPGDEFATVKELLDLVEKEDPDLICAYRHLHSGAWRWPYSLGEELDLLTQVTSSQSYSATLSVDTINPPYFVNYITLHLDGVHVLVFHPLSDLQRIGMLSVMVILM